jgi:UDP-N-acetylmuramoyl-L-alanyl-D-glutamate--2,6-diaminopimelate ligase
MPFLTELLLHCPGAVSIEGDAKRLEITSVTADSRQVEKGALFVAIRGTRSDGGAYALEAVAKGAVAVVVDEQDSTALPASVLRVRVENTRLALAKLAAAFYVPQPSGIAAVTGTDGKTSTADFFRQLWQMSHQKAASIGTLGVIRSGEAMADGALNTTPDPVLLHRTLRRLAQEECKYVALEASSHGLHQYRLDGVKIRAAAFTNLTRDHLDYHGTTEAYFDAKLRLFSELLEENGMAVVNADDAHSARIAEVCTARGIHVIRYGLTGAHYRILKITPTLDGLVLQLDIMGARQHCMLQMVGAFQAMNALAALGLYVGTGGMVEEGIRHLPHLVSVPGRLEKVATHPSGGSVFIDYAHTPAALANVLTTLKAHVKGKLTVVFGCGGDRDKGKRPEMGKAAAELADEVIVTDDNPRSEDPAGIRAQVMAGAGAAKNIGDRAEAIAFAVKSLQKEDVLLIAGKGHEKTQTVGNKILPFDDAQVAREAVQRCERNIR